MNNQGNAKIYLDTSVYNRPFDDQSQPRIFIETLSFVVILGMIDTNQLELSTSSVLIYENSRNPFQLRKMWVDNCISYSQHFIKVDLSIKKRAGELEAYSIKPMDSLHIACAEAMNCECFITCDDRIIKRYNGHINAQTPINFISEMTERGDENEDSK